MTVDHNLLVTDCLGVDADMRHILGQCSCSAWFELILDLKEETPEFAASVIQNGFPPCPAVRGLTNHYEKELKNAV